MENIFFDINKLKHCGKNVIIGKTVRIRKPELVSIGDYSVIDDFTYISGEVEIGKYVHVAASCSLQASKSKITIGDFAGLASGVKVFAASSNLIDCSFDSATVPQGMMYGGIFEEVKIGHFVLIGANSVILPGSNLPIGFTAGALCKLVKNHKYAPWSILFDDNTGKCIRRTGVKKMLSNAMLLTRRNYEI